MTDERHLHLIPSCDHCQRYSPLQISDTSQAGFEPAENLSSDFVELSCAVVVTTTPRHKKKKNVSTCQATASEVCRAFGEKTPGEAYKRAAN